MAFFDAVAIGLVLTHAIVRRVAAKAQHQITRIEGTIDIVIALRVEITRSPEGRIAAAASYRIATNTTHAARTGSTIRFEGTGSRRIAAIDDHDEAKRAQRAGCKAPPPEIAPAE